MDNNGNIFTPADWLDLAQFSWYELNSVNLGLN